MKYKENVLKKFITLVINHLKDVSNFFSEKILEKKKLKISSFVELDLAKRNQIRIN